MRKKLIGFFVSSFLKSQEKLVYVVLQNGRLKEDDFLETRKKFYELADEYENSEMDGDEFFRKNRKIERSFSDKIGEKTGGVSKDRARELYKPLRKREKDVSVDAYADSSRSSIGLILRLPLIKIFFFFLRLRYR